MAALVLSALSAEAAPSGAFSHFAQGPDHPVVFVPGLTSSNLTFTVVKTNNACTKMYKAAELFPPPQLPEDDPFWSCWAYAMQTVYDAKHDQVTSEVDVTVDTVAYPLFSGNSLSVAQPFWQDAGYVVNQTIFCASFDWRMPSIGLGHYFTQLQATVELASSMNGNTTVDLVSVSYGPQVTLSFLHRMTAAWKARYIRWFVAESPVWSGSPVAALAITSGISTPGATAYTRFVSKSIHSLLWLLPRSANGPNAWNDTQPLVVTPSRTYTAADMGALLTDLGFSERVEAYTSLQKDADLANFEAPGVDTFVVYGIEVETPLVYYYNVSFDHNPETLPPLPSNATFDPATGDGIVNRRGSERSLVEWPEPQKASGHKLYHKAYAKQQHAACCTSTFVGQYCFLEMLGLLIKGKIPLGSVGG
jgi:lysophospholipase-3